MIRISRVLDNLYYTGAVDDEDEFDEEPEPVAPLVERGRKPGWTPPQDNPFEWQRTYLHGIYPELRHDNANRQLIHVVSQPDGSFVTHQILSPDAPSNPGISNARGVKQPGRWRVNRFFHDENGKIVPFTDEHGSTVFSESTDHPNSEEAGHQYLSNREWDKFREAGWSRPNRDQMRYTQVLPGDPKIMLHAELVNTPGDADAERPDKWVNEVRQDERVGPTTEAWKVTAFRMRRKKGPVDEGEDPYEYEQVGQSYHPDADSAIAGLKGRRNIRG